MKMAEKKAVPEEHPLKKLYREFGETTSMHGINRVLNTSNRWKRFAWSVVFLFGVGFASFQFVTVLMDFFSYPVTTMVTLKHERHAPFPGITICNLNRKRKSKIDQGVLEELYGIIDYEVAPGDTSLNVYLKSERMANVEEAGHQISDMLLMCVINRHKCSVANFIQIETASFGTCFTFNPEDSAHRFSTRPGPDNALIIELDIQQHEYLPVTAKAGVKVIVHPMDQSPCPEDGGILAQPGMVTSFGIKKVITHQLPAPYSTCIDANGQSSSQRNLFPDTIYSQKTCMKSCYQTTLYERCQCCDFDLPCDYKILNKTDLSLSYCNTQEDVDCEYTVEDQYLNSELDCDERCPLECHRTTFDTVVSTAQWPSDSRMDGFVAEFQDRDNETYKDKLSVERYVRYNYLRLEIFLESLEFLEFTTQAKYDWNLMLGTIGGLLGLWLGFSMLTGLEIVEVLIDTVIFFTCKRFPKRTNIQP